MRKLHLLWLFAMLISSVHSAYSLTYTLNNGNWSNANNWAGNTAPPNPLGSGNAIIIAGNGILNVNNYVVSSGATITVNNGATLITVQNAGISFTNNGLFTNYGTLNIVSAFLGSSKTITNGGTIDNYGTISVGAFSLSVESLLNNGTLNNYGNLNIVATAFIDLIVNNGTINNSGTITRNAGTINHNAGAFLNGAGTLNHNGGTFTSAGALSPGNSPGIFTISSGSILISGTLEIEITGAPSGGAGTTFDQLSVAGTATINGTINVNFGSHMPAPGDMYQIVSAGGYAGSHTLVVTPNTITATYLNGVLTVSSVLPVTWRSFRATLNDGNGVDLLWSTASESNNEGFDVERSANGRDWEPIAFVPGAGTTSEIQTYQYTDSSPCALHPAPLPTGRQACTAYYRLKQTDYSGAFDYSPIRMVEIRNQGDIRVYPNPTHEEVTISFAEPTTVRGTLRMYSQQNRLVAEHLIPPHTTAYPLRVAQLPAGTYILQVMVGNEHWSKRVVVE